MKRVKNDIIDELVAPLEAAEYEPITIQSMSQKLDSLEKVIMINSEQRRNHSKNPEKFLQSEAELNDLLNWFIGVGTAEVEILSALADGQSELHGFYSNLIPLLEHPNSDIGNKIVEVIHEIFHDEEGDSADEIISSLATKCIEIGLLNLLQSHFKTLQTSIDEAEMEDPEDTQAIFKVFEIVEDFCELFTMIERNEQQAIKFYSSFGATRFIQLLSKMFLQDPKAVKTESMASRSSPGNYANRVYAAELCATIFQLSTMDLKNSNEELEKAAIGLWTSSIENTDLIENLLVSISPYRLRDPIDADEQEYLFNLFDCLGVLLLNSVDARRKFSNESNQGFDLFLMLLKEVNVARIRAIQIMDYIFAADDEVSRSLASEFINMGGLKVLSPILMGKGVGKLVKKYPKLLLSVDQDEAHICAIFASLFKNTQLDSSSYFRLIAKFVENSGEKFARLVELHLKYSQKLEKFDKDFEKNVSDEVDEEERLLDRINAGLFVLQQIDICLLLLVNSAVSLSEIEKNPSSLELIEKDLFDAVKKESRLVFVLDDNLIGSVNFNVRELLSELEGDKNSEILNLLDKLANF